MNNHSFVRHAKEVLQLESQAVEQLQQYLDESFVEACTTILNSSGRVVVTGMGKSGHVAGKLAATLASTGTPAFFVHPGEAGHGDLGMILAHDVVLALSHSGETPEIVTILPIIKRIGVKLIAMVGKIDSTLGNNADICLRTSVQKEACPHNLAPTSSTTASMALGDALAVALLRQRGFTREDFAKSHPGGALGKRLLLYAGDIMHSGPEVPTIPCGASVRDALLEMNRKGLGMTGIVDASDRLCGIFTDGDLRRAFSNNVDVYECPIETVMTANPRTISGDTLAAELIQLMEEHAINGLFVIDDDRRVLGALNTLDLIRAGIF